MLFFPPGCQCQMRPGAVRGCLRWGNAVGTTRVTGAGAALASGREGDLPVIQCGLVLEDGQEP